MKKLDFGEFQQITTPLDLNATYVHKLKGKKTNADFLQEQKNRLEKDGFETKLFNTDWGTVLCAKSKVETAKVKTKRQY